MSDRRSIAEQVYVRNTGVSSRRLSNPARLFVVMTLVIAIGLSGCVSMSAGPSAEADKIDRASTTRERLNGGYSALYETADGLARVDTILAIKTESDDVQRVVEDVATYNAHLVQRLQSLARDFPALNLHRTVMPAIVKKATEAQKKGTLEQFAPLVGESGQTFERGLLVRLLGGLDTQRYLARTLAEREPEPALHRILANVATHYDALFDEVDTLLNRRFYR